MTSRQLREWTGTGMLAVALGVLSYLSVLGNETAQGALIGIVSAGVGYIFRGRVEEPK